MKKILKEIEAIKANYKTSIVGAVIFLLATLLIFDVITESKFLTLTGFLISIGFFLGRDSDQLNG